MHLESQLILYYLWMLNFPILPLDDFHQAQFGSDSILFRFIMLKRFWISIEFGADFEKPVPTVSVSAISSGDRTVQTGLGANAEADALTSPIPSIPSTFPSTTPVNHVLPSIVACNLNHDFSARPAPSCETLSTVMNNADSPCYTLHWHCCK